MFEYKQKGIYDVGFIDPYIVNEKTLQGHPKTWRITCSDFLPSKVLKGKFYFLTTSSECFYLVQILFCLLDVKCVIDELCMRVCGYHWILLKIQFDTSSVVILDSLDKPDVLFSDMKAMLQK
jgi:hypothetical protein